MKELSLNILDIAENSAKARASLIEITIKEAANLLTLIIKDDGTGMSEKTLCSVIDPFYTTRTTRKVGLGIPLLKMACEMTGGKLEIKSREDDGSGAPHGTTVVATFYTDHLDFTPLGDVISTVITLIQGHPDIDFAYKHSLKGGEVTLDTRELRAVLEDIPLDTYDVILWIKENLADQYEAINK
ncbi:MAG: sensor histidine kinase [Clostridia bacterium]|nr:sensor histidine kinase [Clostridia bacterium]